MNRSSKNNRRNLHSKSRPKQSKQYGEAISSSSTTQIKINDTPYQVKTSKEKVDLSEDVTKVIITVKNAAGNQVEYKLYIVKENSPAEDDANLKK